MERFPPPPIEKNSFRLSARIWRRVIVLVLALAAVLVLALAADLKYDDLKSGRNITVVVTITNYFIFFVKNGPLGSYISMRFVVMANLQKGKGVSLKFKAMKKWCVGEASSERFISKPGMSYKRSRSRRSRSRHRRSRR